MSSSPRLLYNRICEEDEVYRRAFQVFLLGTLQPASSDGAIAQRPTSQVSTLRGFEDPLKMIRSYVRPSFNPRGFGGKPKKYLCLPVFRIASCKFIWNSVVARQKVVGPTSMASLRFARRLMDVVRVMRLETGGREYQT